MDVAMRALCTSCLFLRFNALWMKMVSQETNLLCAPMVLCRKRYAQAFIMNVQCISLKMVLMSEYVFARSMNEK